MKNMGEGLELAAGNKLRVLLQKITSNRFIAMLVGTLVTAVIQSSSATDAMVVGFANAGLMELGQAIGILFGAKIGTTVTSLLMAIDIKAFVPIFIFLGAVIITFSRKNNIKYYGQILAMRGWSYAYLLDVFTDPRDKDAADLDADAIPVYVGTDVKAGTLGAPLSTVAEVYDRLYQDLSEAIQLLDFYSKYNDRGSKLEVDANVARIMLAYAMLNHGDKNTIVADGKNCYEIALENAKAVIDGGKYPLLKKAELTTTGFADVNAANWMWGQDVTVETTTALGSFFGQVDIHSYSYAAAGDTKGIDSKLYDEIDKNKWDARIKWFRTGTQKFPYCPDGKFYSPKYKNITALDQVDRNWLCDNVFMRVEVAYLIAAEAAWSKGDNTTAVDYLKALCDERVADGKDTEYSTWLASLTSEDAVKEAIIYNWRVEMWGEGYSLQVLRRIQKQRELGTNHLTRANKKIDIVSEKEQFQCQIPTSETRYNPFIGDKTTLQNED